MHEYLEIAIVPLTLTLLTFQIGRIIQAKWKTALFNPILIAVILVILFINLTGMDICQYRSGTGFISWLMTPATICLAVPMYEQFQVLRKHLKAIVLGVAAGALSCLAMILVLCALFTFDRELTVALLPKSITTAIGVSLSSMNGGIASITTAAIIIAGILGNIFGPLLCKIFKITEPIAQGVAFGTAGHVVATSKANELSPLIGAVSSLSLVVAGLITAILFPLVLSLL